MTKRYEVDISSPELLEALEKISSNTFSLFDGVGLFIAALALFISIYFGHLQRKHNRLSVAPVLNIRPSVKRQEFSFSLFNAGIGPALIKGFKYISKEDPNYITSDSTKFLTDLINNLDLNKDGVDQWQCFSNHVFDRMFLKEGHEHFFFKVTHDIEDERHIIKIMEYLKKFEVFIEFSSIYNDEKSFTLDVVNSDVDD